MFTSFFISIDRRQHGLLRRQQEEEGRGERVGHAARRERTNPQTTKRERARDGAPLAARGRPAVPQPPVGLLERGDAGGVGGRDPKLVRVLLAAEPGHTGRREEGEGPPDPRRAAQDGGGPRRVRGRDCAEEPGHRRAEQGAHRCVSSFDTAAR